MSNTSMETCANPGCSEPGTKSCSACKTMPYCGPICQTAHWPTHKESCDGRLRKMGMDHLYKAKGFYEENNWPQALRHSDLAATKLKQLKDRPLDEISAACCFKCTALGFMGRHREQLECAKEWYCLWNTKPTDVGAIDAAFALIGSCIQNNEYADAHLYASTLWEIINHKYDNKIPDNQLQVYLANGAHFLASTTLSLSQNGGIPPQEKQKAGQEAIVLARRALEIHTQLEGIESIGSANDMCVLAGALFHFSDEHDELIPILEQAKSNYARFQGNPSPNVAKCENKLSDVYYFKAIDAKKANNREEFITNLQKVLFHSREAVRINRAIGREEDADDSIQSISKVEEHLRLVGVPVIRG